MTPEQLKAFLARDKQEQEEKFHEVATVGRWQWKFAEGGKDTAKDREGESRVCGGWS